MAVNESVYGAADIWYPSHFNLYITNKNKLAVFYDTDGCRLYHGVSHNKLSYDEPIDKSISYCGLGTESALSHIGYIYKQDGNYAVREWQDTAVTNFAFFQQNVTSLDMAATPDRWYFDDDSIYHTLDWRESGNYSYNCQKNLQPYTLINPKNQVLCIYVKAYNADTTTPVYCDWSTYKNTYKTSYPNIANVNIVAYFNNAGWTAETPNRTISGDFTNTLNTNQRTLSYGRLDSYVCEGKNLEMYCYYLNSLCVLGSAAVTTTPKSLDKLLFVFATETCKEHVKIIELGDNINAYIEYFDGVEDEIFKTVACFGLYFTPTENIAKTGLLTNNDMYIGILDSNGIGHGQYFRGADTVRAPQAADDYTDMSKAGYDPSTPYIDYDNTPHYGTASYESINKMYALTGQQVLQVMTELSNAMSAIPSGMSESDYSTGTFLTSNPIDCIVSLRKYPVYNTAKNTSESYPVMFGGYESQIRAPYAKNVQVFRFDFTGSKAFISNFGDSFLDREPYTTAELYIPFCGTVKLSCDEFIDHAIGVRLILDYRTGSALAYIERDGIPQMSIGGDMGIDIPLTGVQTQTLANTIRRNIANLKQAQISAVQAASGGATMSAGDNPLQLVGGMINIANRIGNVNKALLSNEVASYSLHHTEIPFKSISTGDAVTGMSGEWCCRLSITRPVLSPDFDPETYGKTIGYACLKQGRVSDFTGLTVGTIDLTGINAPAEVKTMIQAAFKQGVYL